MEISEAVQSVQVHMNASPDYAWSWHCNIAVPLMDVLGASHKDANEAAAFLMWHLFDYDVTAHPLYEYGKSDAQQYFELRINAEREEDAALLTANPETESSR